MKLTGNATVGPSPDVLAFDTSLLRRYVSAESGEVNSIVHQWAYEDAADRTRRRANMWGDPEWLVYIQKLNESGYLVEQKNSLMIPTKFCPIKR